MRASTAVTAVIAVSLCACANFDDRRYPFGQGWRSGDIELLGTSMTAFPAGAIDCRAGRIPIMATAPVYAYVQFDFRPSGKFFGSNPKQRHIIAPVAPGAMVAQGQRVHVNIKDCALAINKSAS